MISRLLLLISALAFGAQTVRAQAGPPLLTDDPGTPGNRHWEVNLAYTIEKNPAKRRFEAPRADINYGLGDRIQLKLEIPWVIQQEPGRSTKSGLGNTLVGMKWRFVGGQHGFAMSSYPQLEFSNPSSVRRGLVDRGPRLLLPVEITGKIGAVKADGEIGYLSVAHGPDEILYGFALGRQIAKPLKLLVEIHGTANRNFTEHEPVFNFGGRFKLSTHYTLLFSAGRSLRRASDDRPSLIAYVGMRFNF